MLGAGAGPVASDPPLSAFALPGLDGRTVTLDEYRGKSPVFVFFYRGLWCAYCVDTLVQLQRLAATDLKGLPVVAASPDSPGTTRDGLGKIEKEHGVRFTHRFVSDESVAFGRRYGLKRDAGAPRPPTLVLLDAQGEEVWHYTESHYQVRPIAPLVKEALERLAARAPKPPSPRPPGPDSQRP